MEQQLGMFDFITDTSLKSRYLNLLKDDLKKAYEWNKKIVKMNFHKTLLINIRGFLNRVLDDEEGFSKFEVNRFKNIVKNQTSKKIFQGYKTKEIAMKEYKSMYSEPMYTYA